MIANLNFVIKKAKISLNLLVINLLFIINLNFNQLVINFHFVELNCNLLTCFHFNYYFDHPFLILLYHSFILLISYLIRFNFDFNQQII